MTRPKLPDAAIARSALLWLGSPMRLILLVVLTMTAFAANSVLNRLAVADGQIAAMPFAAIRVASGAAALWFILRSRGVALPLMERARLGGALSLTLYLVGFSIAYLGLHAGVGALILFGVVQVTMFLGALVQGQRFGAARWGGAGVAFAGLVWLLWPSGSAAPSLFHALLMASAGIGWGLYSLIGQRAGPPLPATAANFVLATPLVLGLLLVLPTGEAAVDITAKGVLLALLSGVVTSGMGYALWYTVLRQIDTTTAALAQLSVPLIAMAGGMVFLGEALTLRFVLASALVLGGIAFGILGPQRTSLSSGS